MSMRYPGALVTATYNLLQVPGAPTIGTATAGNASASVTFTAPSDIGGGAITSYTVISSAGQIGTGASSPVTVSGLTNGQSYTFRVFANNAYGPGDLSAASNSVTPSASNAPSTVDFLVIAGGGAGGRTSRGSGGGAGGYRTSVGTSGGGSSAESALSVSVGITYTVTVGSGGTASGVPGGDGNNSVFSTITSIGGGGGGGNATVGNNGGSGGGGGNDSNAAGGSGTANQGYAGGAGVGSFDAGGGGGGAGQAGQSPTSSSVGGNGGNGVSSSISGSSVTRAGGGGAGCPTKGNGGSGGGGNGADGNSSTPAQNGTANTGGGGGGDRALNTNGNGGSGIVIVRYADTFDAAVSTTGSPTITVAGGYRVYQWTGNGSITW